LQNNFNFLFYQQMQTNSNTERLVIQEVTNKEEPSQNEQLQIKAAIWQRIATYLNASKT